MRRFVVHVFAYTIFLPLYGVLVSINYLSGESMELMKKIDFEVMARFK